VARAREAAPLHSITQHMLGAFAGRLGAQRWRESGAVARICKALERS